MTSVPNDYDDAAPRWAALDRSTQLAGDVHGPAAQLILERSSGVVLDIGGGDGELARHLPADRQPIIVDASPTMLAASSGRRVLADASALPVATAAAGAVANLWILYHLDEPQRAIEEAHRVLRPGGLYLASARSRSSDPELVDGYPPTRFDAEEAVQIVGAVLDVVAVVSWDAPLVRLEERAAVERYCVHHLLDPALAAPVAVPLTLTKRGCLVVGRR